MEFHQKKHNKILFLCSSYYEISENTYVSLLSMLSILRYHQAFVISMHGDENLSFDWENFF